MTYQEALGLHVTRDVGDTQIPDTDTIFERQILKYFSHCMPGFRIERYTLHLRMHFTCNGFRTVHTVR